MGNAIIKIKIMPSSPDVNLEEIKEKAKKLIDKFEAKNSRFEEEPIAFGLKAVIMSFVIDENQELEPIENSLKKIEKVSSVQVIDMRRLL
jgi:elongation factor 1-beta